MKSLEIAYNQQWAETDAERDALLADLIGAIASNDSLHVITGAGISAQSGVPTFRGEDGIYNDEASLTADLLSEVVWGANPDTVWRVISGLASRDGDLALMPSPAHEALVSLESLMDVFILTQNVDGLHSAAGSSNVIEIHGSMRDAACQNCFGCREITKEIIKQAEFASPRCQQDDCGGILKPGVVLFGGDLPEGAVKQIDDNFNDPNVILSVGTGGDMPHIQYLYRQAIESGTTGVEVNTARTHLTGLSKYVVRGEAEMVLPMILESS